MIPAFRQTFANATHSSSCLRMNSLCASKTADAFLRFRSSSGRETLMGDSNLKLCSCQCEKRQAKNLTIVQFCMTFVQLFAKYAFSQAKMSTGARHWRELRRSRWLLSIQSEVRHP